MPTTQHTHSFELDPNLEDVAAAVQHLMQQQAIAEQVFSSELEGTPDWPRDEDDRRQLRRERVNIPLLLHPAAWNEDRILALDCGPIVGLARDLSVRGLGMAYDAKLPSPWVIVEFDLYAKGPLFLLMEVRWSRKRGSHDYLGGGEFHGLAMAAR